MGRRRDDDDYEDRPARRASNAPVLVAAAVGGGLVLVVLLGVIAALFLSLRQGQVAAPAPPVGAPAEPPPGPNTPAAKRYTREEFKKMVLGKTPDEVLKAVGKPSSRADDNGGERWFFVDPCYDPVSGSTDHWVPVIFRNGRVSEVRL